MKKRLRVLRWLGLCILVLLALRGAGSLLLDLITAGMTDQIRWEARGQRWTAFERYISYNWIPDSDTSLYLARSVDDKSTWIRLGSTNSQLFAPMVWVSGNHLRIPAWFREGYRTQIDDVVIEWDR